MVCVSEVILRYPRVISLNREQVGLKSAIPRGYNQQFPHLCKDHITIN